MKRFYLLTILTLLACSMGMAQKMTVESFEMLTTDITASTHPRMDANKKRCALVKVQLPRYGATFEGNVIQPTDYSMSEYWVYLSEGSKRLTVKMQGLPSLDVVFAQHNSSITSLQSSLTYRLVISLPANVGGAGDDGQSYLSLSVVPNNTRVTIDGSLYSLPSDGPLDVLLPRGEHTYKLSADGYQTKEGRFILGTETFFLTDTLVSTMATLTVRCDSHDASILVNNVRKGRGTWTGPLVTGTYIVEVLKEGYVSQRQSIFLAESATDTIVFPALKPKTGQIDVKYRPAGAEIWVDDVLQKGKSPSRLHDIPIGKHKVEIRNNGFQSKTETVTVRYNDITYLQGSLVQDTVAMLSQQTQHEQSSSASGQPLPYQSDKADRLSRFYVEGKFQAGMMMGAGISIGAYIHGFNVEGTFLLGLAESEEIAWRQTSQSSNSGYSYTYKPMFYGLKLGYRIPSGSKFRITPQLGIGVASISGTQVQKGSGADPDATSCYAVPASVGVRLEYNITKNFGVSASPEFGFPVMKSDTYTKLSDLSSKVKGFGSGFNARVGVFVSF